MSYEKFTWTTILTSCPYCKESLDIISTSNRSISESIGNIIILSKIHFDRCRSNRAKELANILVKEVSDKQISYKSYKILS
jgi:hypothetical protein